MHPQILGFRRGDFTLVRWYLMDCFLCFGSPKEDLKKKSLGKGGGDSKKESSAAPSSHHGILSKKTGIFFFWRKRWLFVGLMDLMRFLGVFFIFEIDRLFSLDRSLVGSVESLDGLCWAVF